MKPVKMTFVQKVQSESLKYQLLSLHRIFMILLLEAKKLLGW